MAKAYKTLRLARTSFVFEHAMLSLGIMVLFLALNEAMVVQFHQGQPIVSLLHGVMGNTSRSGREESRFET